MINEIQLYINNERVDLFGTDTITITQTIRNAKDIAAIFTDFSQTFSLPASKRNNKIFEHFYNMDIDGGYDANNKAPSEIYMSNELFRKGFIGLDGVNMKDNKPETYRITFFGELVDLKKKLKDLKLRDLYTGYTFLNHTYDAATVYNYARGSSLASRLIYPLISHTNRYYYDSSSPVAGSSNLYYDGSTNQGVNFRDLKPALKLNSIIERINSVSDITLDDSGFLDEDNIEFQNLYMWLARERGPLGLSYTGQSLFTILINSATNWFGSGGVGDINPPHYSSLNNYNHLVFDVINGELYMFPKYYSSTQNEYFGMRFQVSSTSTYSFDLYEVNSQAVIASQQNVSGTNTLQINANTFSSNPLRSSASNPFPSYRVQMRITTTDPTFTCTSEVEVTYKYRQGKPTGTRESTSQTLLPNALVNDIDVALQMPDMTVLDFLTGLCKMFNLVAYPLSNGDIRLEELDNFYTNTTRDISEYVKVDESQIDFSPPYQEVAFRFQEPKTFLAVNFNEINGTRFGDLENTTLQSSAVAQTDRGNKYVLELPFEKVVYERLFDINTGNQTYATYGFITDKDQNPTSIQPLIFWRELQSNSNQYISFQFPSGTPQPMYYYHRPSNRYIGKTINFGREIDEYFGTVVDETLFNERYLNYVSGVYNPERRMVKLKAVFDLKFLLNYKLSDLIVYNGRTFRINSIKTNLQTGESDLELFNEVE